MGSRTVKTKDGKSNEWGKCAERIAHDYLVAQGYVVRETNWRPTSSHLEIDIVAEKDMVMAFIEVKARGKDGMDPAAAVDAKKRRFITLAADRYLRALEFDYEYRFDIITISGNVKEYTLDHIQDAFVSPLFTR